MIERYSRDEMKRIWSDENKFKCFLDVEIAVCKAYNKLKDTISHKDLQEICSKANFDISRIKEIEKETHHDVIAFLTNVAENVGESSRFIHMGLTSSDVVDTALALQMKQAGTLILSDMTKLMETIKQKAFEYKDVTCIGRTHGIHAEPTKFGLKLCNWLDVLERQFKQFEVVLHETQIGQMSGAVGTYSNINPKVEEIACELLGLTPARISTQVISRDIHARFIQQLSLIASTIERIALELRHLQRTEVNEVQEGFSQGQKGSSAMPHKRNPITAENLCGLARIIRSYSIAALEDIPLWHERDISHSSVERIILPDSTILIDYMLNKLNGLIQNMQVNEENMTKNLYSKVLVTSQHILLALCKKGMSREEAYKIVQNISFNFETCENNIMRGLYVIQQLEKYLTRKEIKQCLSINEMLKYTDLIYEKFGI